jgi:hypothetical protein
MKSLRKLIIPTALIHATFVHAFVLDWNTVDWGRGNESQTFANVDGSGLDITITLSLSYDWKYHSNGYEGYWTQTRWLGSGPDDTTDFGGDGAAQNGESLYLGLNFASDDRFKSYLDVTISFSKAVENASFKLFDVDAYGSNYYGGYEKGIQFIDIIERAEGKLGGTTVAASATHDTTKILQKSNSTGTYYQGNTILNDGGADQNDNPKSTLNLAWNSPVDTLSFRYTTGSGAVRDPGQQAIGLSNIHFASYQPVPEPSTVIAMLLLPAAVGFTILRRRSLRQKTAVSA